MESGAGLTTEVTEDTEERQIQSHHEGHEGSEGKPGSAGRQTGFIDLTGMYRIDRIRIRGRVSRPGRPVLCISPLATNASPLDHARRDGQFLLTFVNAKALA